MTRESSTEIGKPGWETAVSVRKVYSDSHRVVFDENGESVVSDMEWKIYYDGQAIPGWAIVLLPQGLCVVKGSAIMSRMWGEKAPSRIAHEMASKPSRFWRDVLVACFESRDPQCETCSSNSPVPHFPFILDHRIHCTCDRCF